jgi:hypothetical protein
MRRIGRLTGMGMCSALALAMPALAQPLTVQVREQPRDSASAVDDADYQWIDDADALLDAIGDAPPDFSFAYDRTDIWGWRTGTGHEIYAEPLGGTIRYYYFEPNSREPFLVQDEDYSFGYRPGGRLIVVYDRDGRLLSRSEGDREATQADWLYRRGRAIHASAQNDRGWDSVDAGYWAEQVPLIVDLRLRWSSARDRHPGWRRWHGQSGASKWRAPLAGERQRRWWASDRFRRWQHDGFRGPPPRFNDDGQKPTPGVRPPRPGWRPGMTPPQNPDGTRPPRPGGRPGWIRPRPPVDGTPPVNPVPGVERPHRPDRPGWTRPRPPIEGRPIIEAPVTPIDRVPDVDRPQRPDRPGWGRPRPPATGPGTTPDVDRPRRPDRPGWSWQRPPGSGETPGARPPRPDVSPPTVERPEPPRTRPDRPTFTRPPGFAPVERPQHSLPPRAEPVERPQFTPRPAPPAPPPPPPPPPPTYVAPPPPPPPPPTRPEFPAEHPQ